MSMFGSKCFNVSICFHAEALSNNPRKRWHIPCIIPYNPIDVTIIIVSQFSQVSNTTSHTLEGESNFATKYKTELGPRIPRLRHQLHE